jgi:penicillin-binding protein 1B
MPNIVNTPNRVILIEKPPRKEAPQHKTPRPSRWRKLVEWRPGPRGKAWLAGGLAAWAVLFGFLVFYYIQLAHRADAKLRAGVFASTLNLYAMPRTLAVGDRLSASDLIGWLRRNGYGTISGNRTGWYEMRPDAVAFFPGSFAGSAREPVLIVFSGQRISQIVTEGRIRRQAYQFPAQLIANLSDRNREKRRLVQFPEIPPALVNAVVSAEDKHFFSHGGFDLMRICKAAYVDLRDGRKAQGASTLSMQLARGLWLEPDKKWTRKIAEILLTMHLEHTLTKQQIFADYANQIYLGSRGTYSINGFGEAARVYFDKDISQLTVPEAALLAGLVQRPSYYNPFRYPARARDRRDVVLRLMRGDGHLTPAEYESALAAPIRLSAGGEDAMASQYFLEMANDELQNLPEDGDPGREAVFTTLDENLQRAAVEAVQIGMARVDAELRQKKNAAAIPPGQPEVALIALDPHTGEIKALVGGRDYNSSQLNHATAERPTGSVFKPFVYATALNTALTGGPHVFTPVTTLMDQPTTFQFGGEQYSPGNFDQNFMGTVTLRQALAHSLNVATVSLAQQVGYGKVAALARQAGLKNVQPTPSMALGAYDCSPLAIAGAYTVFANGGTYVQPTLLAEVESRAGQVLYRHSLETRRVLDARVNYLLVNLMEEVLRSGTGAGVHALGFNVPAAGKTGTSHDGWFAGFTSRLLCVVWVGFDDYRDLGLEGAKSAMPVWAEFMKRALAFSEYRDVREFSVPAGVVSEQICTDSLEPATSDCPSAYTEFFVDGTEPTEVTRPAAAAAESPATNRVSAGNTSVVPQPAGGPSAH